MKKHTPKTYVLYWLSIVFLLVSTYFLYGGLAALFPSMSKWAKGNQPEFSEDDANVFMDFSSKRKILRDCGRWLESLADDYVPDVNSLPNTLREGLFEYLHDTKETQAYWTEILSFTFYSHRENGLGGETYGHIFNAVDPMILADEGLNWNTLRDTASIYWISMNEYISTEVRNASRDPEFISSYWDENKVYFYTFFTEPLYDSLCRKVVEDLLLVKETLDALPNSEEFYEHYNERNLRLLDVLDQELYDSLEYTWPFTFWDRRLAEGNDSTVYAILKEIQNYYDE